MPYLILFKKSAYKELEKLPISVQEDITESIAELSENPRPNGCIRLKGNSLTLANPNRRLQGHLFN